MSRIRSIHPGLFTDEAFMAASCQARILLIGIWTEAWDDGVFEWKPLTLKARIFPVDAVDVPALMLELETLRFVHRFAANGKPYGAVRNFRKYQRPKKPNSSGCLPEDLVSFVGISEPVPNQFPTASEKSPQMEDGGCRMKEKEEKKEKKEKKEVEARFASDAPEKPSISKKGTRLSPGWLPSSEDHSVAVATLNRQRADAEVAKFRDYWVAKAGKDGCKLDWDATWRNWVRRAAEGPAPKAGVAASGWKSPIVDRLAGLIWVEEGSEP